MGSCKYEVKLDLSHTRTHTDTRNITSIVIFSSQEVIVQMEPNTTMYTVCALGAKLQNVKTAKAVAGRLQLANANPVHSTISPTNNRHHNEIKK